MAPNPRRVTKEAHTHPGMCFFAVGGSNHSLEQSCGLFLTGGWTPVTPYAVPCTVAPNPRRVTNALSFWLQLPKRSAIIFSEGKPDRFYSEMEQLGGVSGEVIVPGKEYRISFPECFYDLHTTGGVVTPNLCECSRQSILYVGEEIWGKNRFTVMCEGTILSGALKCCFRVIFQEE